MFFYCFPIITNFLDVSQSFSWLTSSLKLGQYRYISLSGRFFFLNFLGDIPGIFLAPPLHLGKFSMKHPWTQASKFRKNQLGGPCGAYKRAKFWLFYCIFATTCLKCFKFWLNTCERPIEQCPVLGPCRGKYYVWGLGFFPIPSCFISRILPNFKACKMPIKPC